LEFCVQYKANKAVWAALEKRNEQMEKVEGGGEEAEEG
jgi:hypothetical protein